MATLYRILTRLAVAWVVIVGGFSLLIMAHDGLLSDSESWVLATLTIGVPTLLIGTLAWIIKPPSSASNAALFWIFGIAVLILVGGLGARLYTGHSKRLEQVRADAAYQARDAAFRGELRKYCSDAEIARMDITDPKTGFSPWIYVAETSGETPAKFAQDWHCLHAQRP